mmetsp:Transcript_10043/g.29662  ORF Transcript_10043/g.29662 Transcript_10043/m.29662 type:complete len:459 (+) Transcript_10043:1065-2441(+)
MGPAPGDDHHGNARHVPTRERARGEGSQPRHGVHLVTGDGDWQSEACAQASRVLAHRRRASSLRLRPVRRLAVVGVVSGTRALPPPGHLALRCPRLGPVRSHQPWHEEVRSPHCLPSRRCAWCVHQLASEDVAHGDGDGVRQVPLRRARRGRALRSRTAARLGGRDHQRRLQHSAQVPKSAREPASFSPVARLLDSHAPRCAQAQAPAEAQVPGVRAPVGGQAAREGEGREGVRTHAHRLCTAHYSHVTAHGQGRGLARRAHWGEGLVQSLRLLMRVRKDEPPLLGGCELIGPHRGRVPRRADPAFVIQGHRRHARVQGAIDCRRRRCQSAPSLWPGLSDARGGRSREHLLHGDEQRAHAREARERVAEREPRAGHASARGRLQTEEMLYPRGVTKGQPVEVVHTHNTLDDQARANIRGAEVSVGPRRAHGGPEGSTWVPRERLGQGIGWILGQHHAS